jgi:hypothetical protein
MIVFLGASFLLAMAIIAFCVLLVMKLLNYNIMWKHVFLVPALVVIAAFFIPLIIGILWMATTVFLVALLGFIAI